MTHLLRDFGALFVLLLVAGCSTHRMAEKVRLPLHPIHETRMTNHASPGYVLTGVWRVKGASNVVYLVGTSHTVMQQELPLPSSYYAAYQEARELLVESDPLSVSGTWLFLRAAPAAVGFFLKHSSEFHGPKGKTLADYVSPATVEKLRQHYGSAYASKAHYTPVGLLFMNELVGDTTEEDGGVDDLFALLAHRDGKRIRSLDQQGTSELIGLSFNSILTRAKEKVSKRGANAALEEAILDTTKSRDDWRYGDMSASAREVAEIKAQSPDLYEQLLPGRNRRWLPTITRALSQRHNVLVAVGALHLAGEESLIDLLRRDGFAPEQMYGIDRPAR